jgi:hypothetical protein
MSTELFRRYLDLLNEATGQPPADFAPTHFHKNNLGAKIPLMQTPDGSFWWETTATSDDGGPVQRGSARKSIQPWIGDTENRSSGFSGKSSVDGVFKDGKAIEFPEGMTWKEYAAKALSSTATGADGPGQAGQPPSKEVPTGKSELVAPNTTVALPSSGTFSNDDALAALAKRIKDGSATSGGNVVTKSDGTTTGGKNGEEDGGTLGGDTRCAKCGTRKMDHQGLSHAFVTGGSTAPTIAATPGVQPGGAVKRGGVSTAPNGQGATPDVSKVTAALTAIEKILEKYKVKLKENISKLAPVDQMKAWRTLMEYREVDEADRKPTKAEIEAYLKNLPPDEAPTRATPTRATPTRAATGGAAAPNSAISNIVNQLRALAPPETTSTGGTLRQTSTGQTNKASSQNPNAPRFGPGTSMPTTPYQVPGAGTSPARTPAAAASAAAAAAPEASALSKVLKGGKNLLSKLALPIAAVVEIFEGYRQISALPTDMPRDQYRAKVTKIVARLAQDFGLFWVGAILGGALAGVFTGGAGSIVGFVAGGASGIAASYLLGDSVGAISDQIVDKLYGTGGTSSMSAEDKATVMQNITIIQDFVKANPSAVSADLKSRIDRVMAAAKAAGITPGQGAQPPEGKTAAPAVPAVPTTAPAKLNTTLDGIDNLLKKYNFESQEFDSFFDSLTESEQRRFISKHLHLLSESEQMAERRDMLNEAGAWGLGQKGLRWLGRKLYKAGGGASAGGAPVPPAAGKTPWWKPGFKTGVALGVGGTVGGSVVGYFALREILSSLLDTIKDPETAKVITITPEDTAAWIQFNKELEAALPDQATYDALPQDAKDRLSMIAARAEAMDKAIKESRANAQ